MRLDPSRELGPLERVELEDFLIRFRAREIRAPVVVTHLADRWAARSWTHASLGVPSLDEGTSRALEPELAREVEWPDLGIVRQRNLWLAPDGYVSHLHFDLPHNLNTVLRGTKEVVLFAPRETRRLYPYGLRQNRVYPTNSRVDLDRVDLERFPRIARASYRRVAVQPCETLYIPPRHWHFVRSTGESIAVNVWFDREDATLRERLAQKPPRLVMYDILARFRRSDA